MTITDDALRATLADRIGALRAIAADPAGYEAPVTACPGWTVHDVLVHLAIIHGWAAEIISTRAVDRPKRPREVPPDTTVAEWIDERAAALTDALASADLDDEVYAFVGPRPIRWWLRRQVHETLVHVWDAQSAIGDPDPVDPAIAADGLDELLTEFVPVLFDATAFGETERSIHFHATDAEGEWLLRFDGTQVVVASEHAKGDVAARGPAEQLLLLAWNRVPSTAPGDGGIDTFGDADLLARFLAAARF
jgi:uncharacterized protein (TIGR03083 family)